jgi:hypothetical protein
MHANRRLRCCICGRGTEDAVDYVEASLTTDYTDGFQVPGSHAACLNSVVAEGFAVEAHLFGRLDDSDR